ncbi:MAG: hypothetical protein M1816_008119 [Peltula sp. TS41687]|nr:MAG: hypothetical protein M1816_008119 [Peltula sp. TS41687]
MATALPYPQSASSKDGERVIGLPPKEAFKDLALISTGVLGAKIFYDMKSPNDSGNDGPAHSPKPPAAGNRPTKSGAIGLDLDSIPFHDGDHLGGRIRKTMTPDEITRWEKCVLKHGGKRRGTGVSALDLDIFTHCHNEIRLARTLARIKAEQDEWARLREYGTPPPRQDDGDNNDFSILRSVQSAVNRIGNVVRKATVPGSVLAWKGFNGAVSLPVAPIPYIP